MKSWSAGRVAAALLAMALARPALCHETGKDERLPRIGPAPQFTLTDQDGRRVALKELRGKVLAVTFIFASCTDTCPLLTAKMASVQDRLGAAFGPEVRFVSITVDPERDTPPVLKHYAEAYHANPAGWSFLTGTLAEIRDVAGAGLHLKLEPRFADAAIRVELPDMDTMGARWDRYVQDQDLIGYDRERVALLGHDYLSRAVEEST